MLTHESKLTVVNTYKYITIIKSFRNLESIHTSKQSHNSVRYPDMWPKMSAPEIIRHREPLLKSSSLSHFDMFTGTPIMYYSLPTQWF